MSPVYAVHLAFGYPLLYVAPKCALSLPFTKLAHVNQFVP